MVKVHEDIKHQTVQVAVMVAIGHEVHRGGNARVVVLGPDCRSVGCGLCLKGPLLSLL